MCESIFGPFNFGKTTSLYTEKNKLEINKNEGIYPSNKNHEYLILI